MPRWLKWEFWPWRVVYLPVWVYAHWLGLRAWSRTYFATANPAMHLGGFCSYSKWDILIRIPAQYRPPMCRIEAPISALELLAQLHQAGIDYPLILKPDKGERGFRVALIENADQLRGYLP